MLKVATWNVNSLRVRMPHLLEWLQTAQPDIVALQETKVVDADFPTTELAEAGYHALFAGQKTYNGVALLSKMPGTAMTTDLLGLNDPQRRVLGASYEGMRVLNLYVPNGSSLDSDKYTYKLDWLNHLVGTVKAALQEHAHVIVLGDFNIAPADRDVHDPAAWEGSVLVSPAEREALQQVLDLGMQDALRLFDSAPQVFSWWDYRQGAFRRNHGLRIDLILTSPALAEYCKACYIDTEPRSWQRPSDHAPVVAEFCLS